MIVTTRRVGNDADAWADPLDLNENVPARGRAIEFAGFRGWLALAPGQIPHVWGLDANLVVTVSGDLSAAELERVAKSLRPATGG